MRPMLRSLVAINAVVALAVAHQPAHASAQTPHDACDRACLEQFTKDYLEAMIANRPDQARLASDVKYTENQELGVVGKGLWETAEKLGDYQIFVSDTRRSQAAYLGTVETEDGVSMLAVRLRIEDGAISEVETITPGPAAENGTFDLGKGAENLGAARKAFTMPLSRDERRDRWQLIQAADLHYEGIERGNGDIVPFGENCIKIENGVQLIKNPEFPSPVRSPTGAALPNYQAMGCQDQFNTHVWDTDRVTDRRYPVVDEERGIVVAFIMYHQYLKGPCAYVVDHGPACPGQAVEPYTLAAAEAFRVRDGFIEEVEAIFTVLPELRLRGLW
jgi:hypothetical protein